MSVVKKDVSELKEDVGSLKESVAVLEGQMSWVVGEVLEIKSDVKDLSRKLDDLHIITHLPEVRVGLTTSVVYAFPSYTPMVPTLFSYSHWFNRRPQPYPILVQFRAKTWRQLHRHPSGSSLPLSSLTPPTLHCSL